MIYHDQLIDDSLLSSHKNNWCFKGLPGPELCQISIFSARPSLFDKYSRITYSLQVSAHHLLICPFYIQKTSKKNSFLNFSQFANLAKCLCMSQKIYLLPHFSIFLAGIFRICQKKNSFLKLLFFFDLFLNQTTPI